MFTSSIDKGEVKFVYIIPCTKNRFVRGERLKRSFDSRGPRESFELINPTWLLVDEKTKKAQFAHSYQELITPYLVMGRPGLSFPPGSSNFDKLRFVCFILVRCRVNLGTR